MFMLRSTHKKIVYDLRLENSEIRHLYHGLLEKFSEGTPFYIDIGAMHIYSIDRNYGETHVKFKLRTDS
jgi:hypothetical protein